MRIPPNLTRITLLMLWMLAALSLIAVTAAHAQLLNGRLMTSIYSFEKFDTTNVSKTYNRGFQSAFLDFSQGNFSIHTHMQVAATLEKTLGEEPDFRTYYLYAKVKDIGGALDLSLGRVPYYAGVGNGLVDGGLATFRFANNAHRVALYGGARVPEPLTLNGWDALDRNFVLGGQFVTTALEHARIGISYINRQRERTPYYTVRPDSLFNPVNTYITPAALKEQLLGGDVSYDFSKVRLYGRYDYDLNLSQTQRAQLGARADLNREWSLSGDFIYREPQIAMNSFFSLFETSAVQEIEAGADYRFVPAWRAFLRGAYVGYDGESSFRYTVGVAQTYASLMYRGNSGYAGELSSIMVQGSYPLLEHMLIPNASLSFVSYKLNEQASQEDALAFAVGTTVRPFQVLAFDVQVQVLTNEVVKNDVRFLGKLNYWFAENFSASE
jgi:hypothetical protein